MKKLIAIISVLATITMLSPIFTQPAFADICVPTDPDFDAVDCAANGGTVGTPIGIGGGPGGGGSVPIDGGLSLMLAASGAAGVHRIWKSKKQKTESQES